MGTEKKELNVSYMWCGRLEIVVGEVVAADREIGITIINPKTGEYLYCCNGPMSPLCKNNKHWFSMEEDLEEYFRRYDFITSKITEGLLDLEEYNELFRVVGGSPGVDSCPFGQ